MQFFKRVRAILRATLPACAFIVVASGLSTTLGLFVHADVAYAKTPGSTYCFYGRCHRVKTLSEMHALVGKDVSLHSSHYDSCHRDRYNPCGLTSSGEPFFADQADNAASPIYPDGTKLLVWSAQSKEAAVLRVNNAGPYWGNRKLDVSRALARKLGFEHRGVAKLQVRVLSAPTKAEARYKRNRRYAKVHGPIGKFASLDEAEKGLAVLLAPASVTQGKAIAAVPPEFEQWPVVWSQYAALEWPVVGAIPAKSKSAPVQVASVNSRGGDEPQTVANAARLTVWPVVQGVQKARDDTPLVRLALGQPVRRKRQAVIRKARKVRLAALSSKQKPRAKMRKRKGEKRKSQRAKVRKKGNGKLKARATRKSKSKAVAKVATKTSTRRVVRQAKPVVTVRPHVATRQILHRALGRGA